jgi:hypothetical protein
MPSTLTPKFRVAAGQRWMWAGATVLGAVVAGAVAAASIGTLSWNRATAEIARLEADASGVYRPEQFAGLPAPVARYFAFALTPGQPLIRTARVTHVGEFRSALGAAWAPFRSVEHFSASPPGFVWDATIRMAPIVGVRVRDSYRGGEGAMRASVAGLIPVVDEAGTPEMASASLMRYLAEAVWLPTALLPGPHLRWEPISDSAARATLTDAGVTVSVDFHFGPRGEIVRATADRYRDVDGVGVLTPWAGSFGDYAVLDGMQVPMHGEVAWELPEGTLTYWRGHIERVDYVFAP